MIINAGKALASIYKLEMQLKLPAEVKKTVEKTDA